MLRQHKDRPNCETYIMANRCSSQLVGMNHFVISGDLFEATSASEHATFSERSAGWGDVQSFLVGHFSGSEDVTVWGENTSPLQTSESPFEDLLERNRKQRERLLGVLKVSDMPHAERIAGRLGFLATAADDSYPDEAPMSVSSLEGFLGFWRDSKPMKYPDITLSPRGNIRVQWQPERTRHLAIEFLNRGDAKVVVFAPDPSKPKKIARAAATAAIPSIAEIVQPYKAFDWVKDAR